MGGNELRRAFNLCRKYIEEKHIDKLKEVIGKNPCLINYERKTRGTLLHIAAQYGNPEIIRHLVSKGMDINKIVDEDTPIDIAVLYGKTENVKTLIELGAKLHAEESVLNPLLTAIFKGNVGIAKILIDAGVDLTATYGSKKDDWWDALSYARYRGQTIIAKMIEKKLTEQGIEFEQYDYEDEVIITCEEDDEIPEYEQDGNVYIGPYIQAKLGKIVKDIPELFPVADKVTVNIHV